jgi:hypothetical protein
MGGNRKTATEKLKTHTRLKKLRPETLCKLKPLKWAMD